MFSLMRARNPDQAHRPWTTLGCSLIWSVRLPSRRLWQAFTSRLLKGMGWKLCRVFLFLFLAICWAWMNFTGFASAFDNDGRVSRLLVMGIIGRAAFCGRGRVYLHDT